VLSCFIMSISADRKLITSVTHNDRNKTKHHYEKCVIRRGTHSIPICVLCNFAFIQLPAVIIRFNEQVNNIKQAQNYKYGYTVYRIYYSLLNLWHKTSNIRIIAMFWTVDSETVFNIKSVSMCLIYLHNKYSSSPSIPSGVLLARLWIGHNRLTNGHVLRHVVIFIFFFFFSFLGWDGTVSTW
jgi:hypothetical protein